MANSLKLNLPTLDKKGTASKNIDFVYNLKSIHLYSRLFGLVPFTLVRDSNGEVQKPHVGKIDLLWFMISISLYLYLAYAYWIVVSGMQDARRSSILQLGDTMLIVLGLIYGAAICIIDMYNRTRIAEFLKHFLLFDKNVSDSRFRLYNVQFQLL